MAVTRPELEEAKQTLLSLRLLRSSPDRDGLLTPVSPRSAEAEIVAPMRREVTERKQEIAQVSDQIRGFARSYADYLYGYAPDGTTIPIENADAFVIRLKDAVKHCRHELLIMQPTDCPELPDGGEASALSTLREGVDVKALVHQGARSSYTTRSRLRDTLRACTEIRTVVDLPARMLIFDRELAFIYPNPELLTQAAVVLDSRVISFLASIHDRIWETGTVLTLQPDSSPDQHSNEVRASILELLSAGFTDEVIARRLAVSVRTCRRHIAELLGALDSRTRFQAGAEAVRRGLLPLP
ncbi:hypothetical protein [Streptosporangium carneum]|uniref:hypothetical protein n=1 Tax=Streptosporangium carneum TaxID=47481 RepID=UPI0022F2ECD1|nr:hypothetical protein [Streptosporangium carneum]